MKELSFEKMEKIEGGGYYCYNSWDFSYVRYNVWLVPLAESWGWTCGGDGYNP